MKVLVLFLMGLTAPVFSGSRLDGVLKKLNVAPAPVESSLRPYTHAIDEDLIAVYAREADAANRLVDIKLERTERSQRLRAIAERENKKVRERLERASDGSGAEAARKNAEKAFQVLVSNPVSKIESEHRYDPRGDIGFCFGRAALAHYLLLKYGVAPGNLAKIFAVGRLRYKEQLWDFHMATMVKGEKGQWWVVDSLFDKVLSVSDWMDRAAAFDVNPSASQVRFYVTDPRKFQPVYGQYREKELNIKELRPYFNDLFRSINN